ncbi:B-type lectin plumieribetin-like [Lampris incognitus]|uniref:B-type lectin plumieribetin-like n=1 Tax=Lampris incognitus TaxID=2546036 RepID=UPI0024B5D21F|nr:B-type lectin plumieribetin-like [Lampris incognitus]
MNKNHLNTNEELRHDEYLTSLNGKNQAIFQGDSNFVIYIDSTPKWQTNTSGHMGMRLLLQSDGNLVIYTQDKRVVWSTDSYGPTESQCVRLTLTDKGHLVLDRDGMQIWTSANSTGLLS